MNTKSEIIEKPLPARLDLGGEAAPNFHPTSPFPEDSCQEFPFESCIAVPITLRSLGNSLPSERALVVKCLMEVARAINETIPATAENHPQH